MYVIFCCVIVLIMILCIVILNGWCLMCLIGCLIILI